MRRFLFLILLSISLFSIQLFISCSSPLEISDDANLDPDQPNVIYDTVIITDTLFVTDTTITSDTIYIVDTTVLVDSSIIIDTVILNDTTFMLDSIIIVDTITNTDTVTIYDTTSIVDTVIVVVPDSTVSNFICAKLSSSLKEIVWILPNEEGSYELEFKSEVDPQNPEKSLTVTIDGVEFIWNPFEHYEFEVEQFLNKDATITIKPNSPPAHGHDIDICLTIKRHNDSH